MLFNAHRRLTVACPYDHPLHDECEPYATIQQHRPVEECFDDLSWEKCFIGSEEQALAADIQAFTENNSIQYDAGLNTPTLYRQA